MTDAGYAYDGTGNRTAELDGQGDTLSVLRYNRLNLPEEYVSADGDTLKYVYSADGEKLYVEERSSSASGAQGTEYAANYRIENGEVTMIHTDAGYYTPTGLPPGASGPPYVHLWYLKDHLGNNRVLANERGIALSTHHYDPYGTEISISTSNPSNPFLPGMTDSPYKYGGKEWNATTSTYDFEARYLSPGFHRFTTMDPLAEKYYSISPYAYCAGNPVNCIDSEGKKIVFVNGLSRYYWGLANYLVPGKDYWHPTTVDKAKETLNDQNVVFEAIEHIITSSANQRRNRGYRYARRHFSRLAEGLKEGESIKFVTHSMGAAFAEGMADYLREQGLTVDYMLHFSPYQAADIEAKNSSDVLTIDIQTKEDFVLNYRINSKGSIKNAKTVKLPQQGIGNSHTESMTNDLYWREIMRIINEYLYNEQND